MNVALTKKFKHFQTPNFNIFTATLVSDVLAPPLLHFQWLLHTSYLGYHMFRLLPLSFKEKHYWQNYSPANEK